MEQASKQQSLECVELSICKLYGLYACGGVLDPQNQKDADGTARSFTYVNTFSILCSSYVYRFFPYTYHTSSTFMNVCNYYCKSTVAFSVLPLLFLLRLTLKLQRAEIIVGMGIYILKPINVKVDFTCNVV